MVHWLGSLTAFVRQVCSFEESLNLENVHSLPKSVLHVLRTAFCHCKDSDSLYSGRLHLVSDLLQALFKEAVSLQKHIMELLDKTNVNPLGLEKETADMVAVLHMVLEICSVVSKMDHALHANTWKFIIKQSLKHHASVESHLRHHDIVNGLCDDILLSFQSCLQLAEHMQVSGSQENTDQKLFQKTAKLCRFFANSLVHYTKEFLPFLSGSCTRLHQLYIQIHSQFPPSLYASPISEAHKNEIARVFLVALDPLILQLLSCTSFVESVLGDCLDLPREHSFPQCMLFINIMDILPTQLEDIQKLWCTGSRNPEEITRKNIFQAVFHSFMQCSPELSLPLRLQGVSVKGQNPLDITFYEYVCNHLCAYIVSLPPTFFPELEHALLDAVLSHRFLVGEFIKAFSPLETDNFPVWEHLCLNALPNSLSAQIKHNLLTAGISQCISWLKGSCTLGDLLQLNASLSALLAACTSSGETFDKQQQQSDVLGVVSQLWPLLSAKQIASQPCLQHTFCVLLALLASTIQTLEPSLLIQVISLLASLFKENPPDVVRLAALDFLTLLGNIFIPQDAQAVVLPKLSSLFSVLLGDSFWLTKQHALETFTQFAEETSHEQVVPDSLTSEHTKSQVIAFLNKAVSPAESESARLERIKGERGLLADFFVKATRNSEQETPEPLAKRARPADYNEEQYEGHIEAAERAFTAVQSLLQKSTAPAWLSEKLQHIQTLLTALQRSAQAGQHTSCTAKGKSSTVIQKNSHTQ
uniref:Chromosome 1 open reading frame 112 n=1 Tax=Xenopus tropicalis TaxID=8364 RepID=F6ZQG4_XENTR